jgi:cytochrome P450
MESIPAKGAVCVSDLFGRPTRSARSLRVNVALMRAFRRSPMEFLNLLVASGAGTTPLRMGPEQVLLVGDAADVWELLTTHARVMGKGRGLVRARLLLGDGLLTSEGDAHLRDRRTLQPAFHPQRITDYAPQFACAARRRADRWSDSRDVDLIAETSAMTLDGVGRALFGSDIRAPTPEITRALSICLPAFGSPWLREVARCSAPRCRSPFGCGQPRPI